MTRTQRMFRNLWIIQSDQVSRATEAGFGRSERGKVRALLMFPVRRSSRLSRCKDGQNTEGVQKSLNFTKSDQVSRATVEGFESAERGKGSSTVNVSSEETSRQLGDDDEGRLQNLEKTFGKCNRQS